MSITVHRLTPAEEDEVQPRQAGRDLSIPPGLLIRNPAWFSGLRFVVAAFMLLSGIVGLLGRDYFTQVGIDVPRRWPILVSVITFLVNIGFFRQARIVAEKGSLRLARIGLWAQIIFDLLMLTVVVHFLGSTNTFAAFAYLFHIVLACIFFSRRNSLLVTLSACGLYAGIVLAESSGLVASSSIFIHDALMGGEKPSATAMGLHVGSALAIWITIWHLASLLTSEAWQRDAALAEANKRLVLAGKERVTHMLRTTHELKAPFAAIHANTQLLLQGLCGTIPDSAINIVERIDRRCVKLSEEIKQMLQLANLQSRGQQDPPLTSVDLADCLAHCLSREAVTASGREVTIVTDLRPVSVLSNQDHLRMVFENLISNAVAYSHPGGSINIRCGPNEQGVAEVSIKDHGIGIPEDKVPKIFDDYYRTEEAVSHNKSSTGLGLAVVRRIAQKHGLEVVVETELAHGTTFRVAFPSATTELGQG